MALAAAARRREKQRLTDLLAARVESLPDRARRVRAYLLLTGGVVRQRRHPRPPGAGARGGRRRPRAARPGAVPPGRERRRHRGPRRRPRRRARRRGRRGLASPAPPGTSDWRSTRRRGPRACAAGPWPTSRAVLRAAGRASFMARTPGGSPGSASSGAGARDRAGQVRRLPLGRRGARRAQSSYALARLHLCELELRAGGGTRPRSCWTSGRRRPTAPAALADVRAVPGPALRRPRRRRRCAGVGRAGGSAGRVDGRPVGLAGGDSGARALRPARQGPAEAVRHLHTVWDHTQREGVLDPAPSPPLPTSSRRSSRRVVDEARRWSTRSRGGRQAGPRVGPAAAGRGAAASPRRRVVGPRAPALAAVATAYGALGLASTRPDLAVPGAGRAPGGKWGAARTSLERAVRSSTRWAPPGGPTTRGPSSTASGPAGPPPPAGSRPRNAASPSSPPRGWPTRRSPARWWSP